MQVTIQKWGNSQGFSRLLLSKTIIQNDAKKQMGNLGRADGVGVNSNVNSNDFYVKIKKQVDKFIHL